MMGFLEVAALFGDVWRLYRKYFSKELSDADYETFKDSMYELYAKYDQHPLAKDMLVAIACEIERKEKCRRK